MSTVDYFALLNFPRAPWLDPAEVQARFLEMSAAVHPDRVHHLGAEEKNEANAKFSELNKAATTLRNHKERLHHLIALESGAAPSAAQEISSEWMDALYRISHTCRSVDEFLAERSRATSPMIQAQLFAKGLHLSDAIADLQQRVDARKKAAEEQLRAIARNWPDLKQLDGLVGLAHAFAVIGRWEAQLQERFAALAAA